MSDGSVKWMSYDELAAAMGINRESARQLAIRKRWGRRKGNDGKARVGVPEDTLRPDPRPATGPSTSESMSSAPSDVTAAVQVLTRHIERLEQELATAKERADEQASGMLEMRSERDALAARLEALRTVLEIEKQRTNEWKAVADRFAQQAEKLASRKPWWLRLVG